MNITYKVHSKHKHSVRITPTTADNNYTGLKLPDIYVTHDVLDYLHIDKSREFLMTVSFHPVNPRRHDDSSAVS